VALLRQAVPRLTAVDLASAEYELDTATDSVTAANWRFHRALYRGAGWSRGLAIAEMLHAAMAPYVLLYLRSLGGGAPSDDEHRGVLDACRNGDADTAVALLEVHLDNAMHTVIDFLRCQPTPT
jgi:DNA-binding GntR family transcriptional regulator